MLKPILIVIVLRGHEDQTPVTKSLPFERIERPMCISSSSFPLSSSPNPFSVAQQVDTNKQLSIGYKL